MDYKILCESAVKAAREAGALIRSRLKDEDKKIEVKGKRNFVTETDKAAEAMIINTLSEAFPESGFIAEEGTSLKEGKSYNWVIDPLDGTTNFIHGAPPVAVSIALMKENKVVAGVIYEVWHDEVFYSWEGAPAFLNGRIIRVSETAELNESLIATGFPYESLDKWRDFMDSLDHFYLQSHGIRRLGSAATDLAYVACGRYDGFYEYNLHPWDVAAGAFLVIQAGGKVSDFKGGDDYIFGREMAASNSKIFTSFLKDVGSYMNKI